MTQRELRERICRGEGVEKDVNTIKNTCCFGLLQLVRDFLYLKGEKKMVKY